MHTASTPSLKPSTARRHRLLRGVARVAILAGALALSACGGWMDDEPAAGVDISGVAATGAPIVNGEVKVVNAKGESVITRTSSTGSYTVTIADAPPYVLSVVDAGGNTWYSYAATAGTAHITPLTTLALLDANANKPLADLVASWRNQVLSDAQVLQSAQKLNANLSSLMSGAGVDARTVNVFTAPGFAANRTGLDAVLDAMRVKLNCTPSACSQSITSPTGSVLVEWNGNIATTGISVSWTATTGGTVTAGGTTTGGTTTASGTLTVGLGSCKAPVAGTWSLVVQTTVSGLAGVPIPEICVDGLPAAPSSQAEFCASDTAKAQLPPGVEIVSCSFSGDTGTIAAKITTPVVLEYTVKYTFVKR
jgi:hypothetical protein